MGQPENESGKWVLGVGVIGHRKGILARPLTLMGTPPGNRHSLGQALLEGVGNFEANSCPVRWFRFLVLFLSLEDFSYPRELGR